MAMPMRSNPAQIEFDQVMNRTLMGEDVVVDRQGAPWAVVIQFQRYQQLVWAERELLRTRLQQASASASARAAHLSETDVDNLIERARNEANTED